MAEQEIKTTISPISDNTKNAIAAAIAEKSVQYFPNNPSAAGKTPQQIKDALTQPIIDASDSILKEIDRVIEEANKVAGYENQRITAAIQDISKEASNRYAADVSEKEAREEAIAGCVPKTALQGEGDPKAGNVPVYQEGYGSTSGEYFPILFTGNPWEWWHAANKGYVDDEIESEQEIRNRGLNFLKDELAKEADQRSASYKNLGNAINAEEKAREALAAEVNPRLTALETALAGMARSYVIEDLAALEELLAGSLNGMDNDNLITGDNILLRQQNAPDFWFEKTATAQPPTYTYTEYDESGNVSLEVNYTLCVKQANGTQVGVLHVLESDYAVIEGKTFSAHRAAEEAKQEAASAQNSANEAKAAAQSANDALGDYVKNTDYASVDKAGVIRTTRAFYINPDTGAVNLVTAQTNDIDQRRDNRAITPECLDYAVRVALTTNAEPLTDEQKKDALEWLGVKEDKFFKTVGSSMPHMSPVVEIPQNVKQYAYVAEIHGAHSTQVIIGDQGYEGIVRNYPKVIRDPYKGEIFFALPDDVCSRLTDFGIEGNYIFFEDGKAYYKQTRRVGERDPELADGERIVETIDLTATIIELAGAVVTDVSGYITFDGLIDLGDLIDKEGEERYMDVAWKAYESDVEESTVPDVNGDKIYTFRIPIIKIRFELQ